MYLKSNKCEFCKWRDAGSVTGFKCLNPEARKHTFQCGGSTVGNDCKGWCALAVYKMHKSSLKSSVGYDDDGLFEDSDDSYEGVIKNFTRNYKKSLVQWIAVQEGLDPKQSQLEIAKQIAYKYKITPKFKLIVENLDLLRNDKKLLRVS